MRYNSRKTIYRTLFFLTALFGHAAFGSTSAALPKGLMLNLDFQQEKDGLIPSKALYPLYVPRGDLGIETVNNRNMLAFQFGQGLNIPPSTLLDPDGSEWIVSTRIFALTDGVILSQANNVVGYLIYLKDGVVHCEIKTGHSSITLAEAPSRGTTDCLKTWVTIDLRIKPDMAILSLNRKRAALVQLTAPLAGENLHIRLGNHHRLPAPFKYVQDVLPDGFTGGMSSLKIHRQ